MFRIQLAIEKTNSFRILIGIRCICEPLGVVCGSGNGLVGHLVTMLVDIDICSINHVLCILFTMSEFIPIHTTHTCRFHTLSSNVDVKKTINH